MRLSGLTVLSVSGQEEDHLILGNIFTHSNWTLHTATTIEEARRLLRSEESIPVVISERDLPDGSWKDLLADLRDDEKMPVMVVSSRVADDYLWAEVLNLGGCDVLAKTFDSNEVIWTVSMAWNDWKSRTRLSAPAMV
jgi:DNA-binding response OmpR family regulator